MIEGGRAVRQSPLLLTILCITLFAGMASEGFDRLQTAHFIKDFVFPGLGTAQAGSLVWHHQHRRHASGACCNRDREKAC